MFTAPTLIAFVIASAAIIIAPGPAQALVLARTLSQGRRAGLWTAIGLNVGTIVHAIAAGVGLSAMLLASALAFDAVKLAGAGYLVYLGIQAWRQGADQASSEPVSGQQALARAIVTGILNPKVALFFVAFLPQFTDPSRGSVLAQCIVLGMILAAMDIVYESVLIWLSDTLSSAFANPRAQRWRNRCTGVVLVGLGARLAFAERR